MGGRPRPTLRWLWLAMGVIIAAMFAYLNSGERVAMHVGFTVLYQLPLVWLVFTVYLLGMATMYVLGLRHDRRVRRLLREHGIDDRPPPPPRELPPPAASEEPREPPPPSPGLAREEYGAQPPPPPDPFP